MIGQDEGSSMAEARILNVNDEANDRDGVTRVLRDAGFEVIEADSGQRALELARAPLDLVILDIELPDVDGFEVARRIRADPDTRLLPVLHLSAKRTDPASRAQGLQSGGDGYLTQPVESVELLATVRALIRWRRRGSGEDRWTVVQSRPVRDESGRVTLAINILHDFTERRRNEQRMALLSEASAV